ncbi:hypothetical protein ACVMIH_001696 [Bradyrhizobium sp. USDA 4503]
MFSVVEPATDRKLTTLENVKTELGITDGTEDAKIGRLIDRLSAMVCDYLLVPAAVDGSKTLGLETLEEKFVHSPWFRRRRGPMILARHPVTEIVSVTIGTVTIDPTDYDFDGGTGEMWRLGVVPPPSIGWAPGVRTVVRFKAGWTLPATANFTLPLAIEGAVIGMIRAARFAADRDPTVKSEWTTDIERLEYWVGQIGENGAFPPDIAAALEQHGYEPEFG